VSLSRRQLAAARRRVREDPSSVVEVALLLAMDDAEDGEPDALDREQITRLGWWYAVHPEALA